jgi:hypothetical protein
MSRSRCAMSNNQRNGISKFWVSSDGMPKCGRESPPSSAREIPRLRCFRCGTVIQNLQRAAAGPAYCISLFVRTGKIFSGHNRSLKSAASNSNSKTTKFLTPFTFAIPTATISKSQRIRFRNLPLGRPKNSGRRRFLQSASRHCCRATLRDSSAAVLIFFAAAAWTRLVAADLWH